MAGSGQIDGDVGGDGAVFEQLEAEPHTKGALRRSMSSRVNDDLGFKQRVTGSAASMARTESSGTVAAAAAAAGGCGLPQYGGYSNYLSYLLAWGLGWLEPEEALTPDNASVRMRRSMSSRVMQQSVIAGSQVW